MYVPREAIDARLDLCEWKHHLSTGPFIPIDFVPDSHTKYKKNPNYWAKDSLLPDNPLPYLDYVIRVVADDDTKFAMMETGKVDVYSSGATIDWSDRVRLEQMNKGIIFAPAFETYQWIAIRFDKDSPWNDLRVRQAALMAINHEEIVEDYYGGNGRFYHWAGIPGDEPWYLPYEDLKEQHPKLAELWEYNPVKARKLLSEAGHPDGFETILTGHTIDADVSEYFFSYMQHIGIAIRMDNEDYAQSFLDGSGGEIVTGSIRPRHPTDMLRFGWDVVGNLPSIPDLLELKDGDRERIEGLRRAYLEHEDIGSSAEIWKELAIEMLEYVPLLPLPTRLSFNAWQPWVSNYGGENIAWMPQFMKYVAIDADLRQQETGRGPND